MYEKKENKKREIYIWRWHIIGTCKKNKAIAFNVLFFRGFFEWYLRLD